MTTLTADPPQTPENGPRGPSDHLTASESLAARQATDWGLVERHFEDRAATDEDKDSFFFELDRGLGDTLPPDIKADWEVNHKAWWDREIAAGRMQPYPTPAASKPPAAARPSIGTRTLADIDFSPSPPQLYPPFLAPEGVTVLYGKGGVGKGMTAMWLTLNLVRAGHTVMVVDYENHPREWGSRAMAMGYTMDDMHHVHYRCPYGDDWEAARGSLAEVADLIAADARDLNVTYLVLDSYTAGTSSGDSMGGQAAAQEFFSGIATIGLPALVLAHVSAGQDRFPEKPFGSVFVHNFARETWAVEEAKTGSIEFDRDTHRYQPTVKALELRCMKKNDGVMEKKPQFVTFSFFFDGHTEVTHTTASSNALGNVLHELLTRLGAKNIKEIVKALRDEGEDHGEETVRTTLKRAPQRFRVDKTVTPNIWSAKQP